MPFLLRRTKDEVLSDLPEKIIQDRYCNLSPVQLKLYEQFCGSHVKQEISSMVKRDDSANNASPKASTHVFQVMSFLLFNVLFVNCKPFWLLILIYFSISGTPVFAETL